MSTTEERREFVVSMARFAWNGYVHHAWPHDMLRPVTKDAHEDMFGSNSGQTIVNAMSTLKVMNLEEDFTMARNWVANEMRFSTLSRPANVFQIVSEYIGGLLSCYALTNDSVFLEKSKEIATLIKPAYKTLTGIPFEMITPNSRATSGTSPYMTYLGTGLLEYPYLSHLTKDPTFKNRVDKIRNFIAHTEKTKGLYREKIDSQSGAWCSSNTSLFGANRDYIANLMKRYIQSGKTDLDAVTEFRRVMDAAEDGGLFATSPRGGLVYCRNYDHDSKQYGDFMNNTGCYLPAVLALDAFHQPKPSKLFKEMLNGSAYGGARNKAVYKAFQRLTRAKELTETFHEAGKRSVTGLMPRNYYFDLVDEATNSRHACVQYFQRQELAESYFIMHRLTHDERYREYAWHLVQSIDKHCRTDCGFVELTDATTLPPTQGALQYAEFMGATLKYLYLIFCDDSVLPLDKWVFNSVGQPLPILNDSK